MAGVIKRKRIHRFHSAVLSRDFTDFIVVDPSGLRPLEVIEPPAAG